MLVEKFDFLEFLRLAIAQGRGEGKKISKDIVLGEIALMPKHSRMWACLLIEKIDFERIAVITPAKEQYKWMVSKYNPDFEWERRIEDLPGKVEFKKGEIKSADFFRVRNVLASEIVKEMNRKKFKPNNAQGDLINIAKGLAEVVLRGNLLVKAMCGTCQGLGKLELCNASGFPCGVKPCLKCEGSGKRPYTLHEKITIANLNVSKSGYSERYSKFELVGESIVAQWENEIRGRLSRAFNFELVA